MTLWYHHLRQLEGYHFGVLCCALVAAAVFIINLTVTIWAVSTSDVQNGLGTLYDGNCKRTSTLTFWAHLAINILSTLLLGASNYSMQCLSSPTRSEIDKAHDQGIWLDIGVPSVRNLRRLSKNRIILWWLLAISSIPLHLLYNSAVFSSLCSRGVDIYLVSSHFLDGAPFDPKSNDPDPDPRWENLQAYQKNQASLVRLENKACSEAFTAPIISSASVLILISDYSNSSNSLIGYGYRESRFIPGSPYHAVYGWNGSYGLTETDETSHNTENWTFNIVESVDASVYLDLNTKSRIQYCLTKREEEHCRLQFSLAIMIIVITCNLLKTICMSKIAWKHDREPLVTLGDAVASFLDRPDMTTKGNCIVGKTRFEDSKSWDLFRSRWGPKRLRWFRAASSKRWLFCNIL